MENKIQKWICLLLTLLLLLSFACQRDTAKTDLVQSNDEERGHTSSTPSDSTGTSIIKDDSVTTNYEEIIALSPAPITEYDAPQQWVETIELNNNLKLEFNVPIEKGDENTHPVFIVTRKRMNPTTLLQWIKAAFPNTCSIRKEVKSIEELQNELLRLDRGMYVEMNENWNPVFEPYDEYEKQEMRNAILAQIESLPEELTFLQLAEENVVLQDTPIGLLQTDGSYVWMRGFDSDNGSIVFLNVEHDPNIQREVWLMQGERMPGGPGPIDNILITQAEAEEITSSVFKNIGRDDYQLAYVQKARNVSIFPTWGNITSEGWYLIYTPAVTGSESAYYNEQDAGAAFRYNRPYTKGWKYEAVEFYISDRGIEQVVYSYPYEIIDVANNNVPLLPFSEIQNSICTFLKQGYEWTEKSDAGIGDSLVVSRVVLTETIVPQKSDPNKALLIPVWVVYYQGNLLKMLGFEDSVLLINAIDGSLIQTY